MNWNTPDSPYGPYAGLSPREASRRAAVADRARQSRLASDGLLMRGLLATLFAIVALGFVALWGMVDAPSDHYGPDEQLHVAAGRLEVAP